MYRISICCAAICRFGACFVAMLSCFGIFVAEDVREYTFFAAAIYEQNPLCVLEAPKLMSGYMIAVMVGVSRSSKAALHLR